MRAILYDCRDHLNPQYRGVTLRLIDDDGRTVLQGQVLTNDGRDLAQRIATGLGAELTVDAHGSGRVLAGLHP